MPTQSNRRDLDQRCSPLLEEPVNLGRSSSQVLLRLHGSPPLPAHREPDSRHRYRQDRFSPADDMQNPWLPRRSWFRQQGGRSKAGQEQKGRCPAWEPRRRRRCSSLWCGAVHDSWTLRSVFCSTFSPDGRRCFCKDEPDGRRSRTDSTSEYAPNSVPGGFFFPSGLKARPPAPDTRDRQIDREGFTKPGGPFSSRPTSYTEFLHE